MLRVRTRVLGAREAVAADELVGRFANTAATCGSGAPYSPFPSMPCAAKLSSRPVAMTFVAASWLRAAVEEKRVAGF